MYMNGDNVGRIEGENGNLGSNGEDFSNDLDINKNPDTGDYSQEYEERSEQVDVNPSQEKEVMDSETDSSLEERREKRKKTYKRIVNGVVLGSMLTQAGGSAGAITNAQQKREKEEDNITPVSEQYHEDITSESTEDKQEFTFLDPSIGSGLDREGFAKEEITGEKEQEGVVLDERKELGLEYGYKFNSISEFLELIPSGEFIYPKEGRTEKEIDKYFELLKDNNCINSKDGFIQQEVVEERVEQSKEILEEGGNIFLLPASIPLRGGVVLGLLNINGRPASFGVLSKDAKVILSERDISTILDMGGSVGVSLGSCLWNWDIEPPGYSCGGVRR